MENISPQAALAEIDIRSLVIGEKLVMFSILGNVISAIVAYYSELASIIIGVPTLVMAIVGVFKLATTLQYGVLAKSLFFVGALIPFINLMVYISLCSKANVLLRNNGYEIGFLGAKVASDA